MSYDPAGYDRPRRLSVWANLAIIIALVAGFLLIGVLVLGALLFPSLGIPREVVRRAVCTQNLKQIGIALQNYHDTFKRFPPAYIVDADGQPMHSWRVLLLPYFEDATFSKDETLRKLYTEYDLSEPWNGTHNRKLADRIPDVYRCPSSAGSPDETGYVAVVGPETGWPGAQTVNKRDITDGSPNTIAVTEIRDSGIHWMEPRDLTLEQASAGINPPLTKLGVSSPHAPGANCLFFDGSVHYLQDSISPELFRAFLTANGGEDASLPSE